MKIKRTDEHTGSDFILLGNWTIPQSVGEKLIPYTLSGQSSVDNKNIPLFSSTSSTGNFKSITINKNSNTELQGYMYTISNLNLNTDYVFRVESTFLLSENLVPQE